MIVSSGRGVHEAHWRAAELCPGLGWSICRRLTKNSCCSSYDTGKLIVFAEQNNGYIWQNFLKVL